MHTRDVDMSTATTRCEILSKEIHTVSWSVDKRLFEPILSRPIFVTPHPIHVSLDMKCIQLLGRLIVFKPILVRPIFVAQQHIHVCG